MLANIPNTTKGVLLALVSTALFVVVGMIVRMLSDTIDTFQILFFRQLIFIAVLMPAIARNLDILVKPKQIKLHTMRIIGAFTALYLGFVTVSQLPFADAQALGFLQVLFVALISRSFLAETVSPSRWFTIAVGFVGVILIVQPSFYAASFTYVITGVIAAIGAAVAVICVRKVAQTEPQITLLTYQAVFIGLIAFIPSLNHWHWPTWQELSLLILVGLLSSVGQWVGVTAYKYGQANIIANVQYVSIIYSLILGFLIFAETPNLIAITGTGVLILSAALPLLYQNWKTQYNESQSNEKSPSKVSE
ncbi:hypothetical protein A3K86_15070 [Photobacterium jeanii]|uniref:EamA domain-containing protein n=1 Tax=Photobacterium jeanii TaxID=858640 RepID=A0A178K7P2_9GAMM|nr:hypothetical protein A3K86_15070 [Photobacterium jeanii]